MGHQVLYDAERWVLAQGFGDAGRAFVDGCIPGNHVGLAEVL